MITVGDILDAIGDCTRDMPFSISLDISVDDTTAGVRVFSEGDIIDCAMNDGMLTLCMVGAINQPGAEEMISLLPMIGGEIR